MDMDVDTPMDIDSPGPGAVEGRNLMTELFLEIFKHVSDAETNRAIGCVNKAFHILVRDSQLAKIEWYSIADVSATMALIAAHPHSNLGRHPTTVTIKLKYPDMLLLHDNGFGRRRIMAQQEADEHRQEMDLANWRTALGHAATFSHLHHLTLWQVQPRELDLILLLASFSTIKSLTLKECQVNGVSPLMLEAVSDYSNLEYLVLDANRGCRTLGLSNAGMLHWMAFVPSLTKLQRLTIKLDSEFTHAFALNELHLPALPELELFIGANCPPLPIVEQFIIQCTKLRSLRILTRRGADLQMGLVKLSGTSFKENSLFFIHPAREQSCGHTMDPFP